MKNSAASNGGGGAADGSDGGAPVQLEFEGLTLLTDLEALSVQCVVMGWRHNADKDRADQRVIVFTTPDHPVKRFKLTYQDGTLIGITAEYRTPDPSRTALREAYPRRAHDGEGWVMSDADRQVLVQVLDDGSRLQALHTGAYRDRAEAAALHRTFLPD